MNEYKNITYVINNTIGPKLPLVDTKYIPLYIFGCGLIIVATVMSLFVSIKRTSCLYSFWQWFKLKLYILCCCCMVKKNPQIVEQRGKDLQNLLDEIIE